MVQINFALKEINCKVVYYGPGLSGKTTNLEVVHSKAPKTNVGELTSIATEGDRTLFFDFLPLNLGTVAGMTTKFQIYTVPGQVYYNSTRKLVLQGADGIVFVADSRRGKMDENLESLANLEENLQEYGMDINAIPLVLQYNKRDLPDVYTVEELQQKLNRFNAPCFEAVAVTGEGVFPTLKKLSQMVLETLNRQQGSSVVRAAPRKAESPAEQKATAKQLVTVSAAPTKPAAGGHSPKAQAPVKPQQVVAPPRERPKEPPESPPQTRVVKEPVTDSNDIKKIERKAPTVGARVRKKSPVGEPPPETRRGSRAGIVVAALLVVLAGAGAALYFGGILG